MGHRRACLWPLFQRCNPKAKAKTRKDLASAQVVEAEWPEMILKEQNNQEKILTDRVLDVNHEPENMPSANGKRPSDSSLSHEEDLAKVIELQEVIDRQSWEQSQMKETLAALSAHVKKLEVDLDTAMKDLLKSEDVNTRLQRDIREMSDGGRVCCSEVECGSLFFPVVSALGWLREQEQSSGKTATGCLPASVSRSLG